MALSMPTLMAALPFVRPLWLLALMATPLLWWQLKRWQLRRDVWRDAVDPHLLPHLLHGRSALDSPWRIRLFVLAYVIATLSLAGPGFRQSSQSLWQGGRPVVIALDLSSASLANDIQPSRLLLARSKIRDVLQQQRGGQVALVAYAEDAYTVSPLTDDAANIELYIDALSPDVMPQDGSRPDRGIEESVRLLKRAGFDQGDIILIGHRADIDARTSASKARSAGFRVSALGLGTAAGATYRMPDGGESTTRLESAGLRALAAAGGGAYAKATVGDSDLRALGNFDTGQVDVTARTTRKHGTMVLDDGYWLLLPLLALALLAFRRGALVAILLMACLPLRPADAADRNLWQRQEQRDFVAMQQGYEAYRKEDYAKAARVWEGLPGADAAYNRGNALAKLGRYDEAIAEYDRALREQPGMTDAKENRQRVDAARKRREAQRKNQQQQAQQQSQKPQAQQKEQPPSQQKNQAQSSQQQNAQRQESPGEQQNPQQTQARSAQSKPQPGSNQQLPLRQPPAGQAQVSPEAENRQAQQRAQREADAALRERLRHEQARAQAGKPEDQRAKENATVRGRRLANDTWLSRVPDEPGELLREKFLLEERRRRRDGGR